jgi:SAM-dependent methyltransferase
VLNRRTLFVRTAAAALVGQQAGAKVLANAATAATEGFGRGFDGHYERLPKLDLESRFDFIWGVQNWLSDNQSKAAAARADEILNASGIDPAADASTQMAVDLLGNDPLIAAEVKLYLTAHQLKLAMLAHEFHGNEDFYLAEMDQAAQLGPGTLELNEKLRIPVDAQREIHAQPGGFNGDAFAGHIYRYGLVGLQSGHNFQDENQKLIVAGIPMPPDGKVRRILDIGCGIGHISTAIKDRFPDAEVWAIDASAPMLRYAHLRATEIGVAVKFAQRLGQDTRFPDNYFDVVAVIGAHHEMSPETNQGIIREVARILRSGGVYAPMDVYTSEPIRKDAKNRFANWWNHRWYHEDWKPAFAELDLRQEIRNAGMVAGDAPAIYDRKVPNIMGLKPA